MLIPPRGRALVNLEYVARLENADYSRDASFVNTFNNTPEGNLTVTGTAMHLPSF